MGNNRWSWIGGVGAAAAAFGLMAAPALAEDVPGGTARDAVVEAPAPPLLSGPSLYETGRIGRVDLSDTRSDVKIQQGDGVAKMPKETSVQAAADAAEDAVVTGPRGVIGADALERETELHFASLMGCRLEVARRQQVTLGAVEAGRMTLRWTITPAGLAADTEVVARDPIDPQLVDCVKRRMSLWEFTRPHGGPVRVARAFAFR